MVLLKFTNNHLLVCANREILFLDGKEYHEIFKLVLPEVVVNKVHNNNKQQKTGESDGEPDPTVDGEDDDDENVENNKVKTPAQQLESYRIQHIATSADGKYLAVSTIEEKCLYLYNISTVDNGLKLNLISKRSISRTSNALRFSPESTKLLLADKTGDCFLYSVDSPEEPAKWLLAHFSILLDVLFTSDQKFIITCDRDEKIRVTNYPKTYNIENYCLGHSEYVSCIDLLLTRSSEMIVSISGDKTLRLWNYLSGQECALIDLPAPALQMVQTKVNTNTSHVAITLFKYKTLIVIVEIINKENDGTFELKQIDELKFENAKEVTNILYDGDGKLVLATISGSNDGSELLIHKFKFDGSAYKIEDTQQLNETVKINLKLDNIQTNPDEISALFKKKYDNIHDYQERKKRRIEDKNKNANRG